MSNRNLTGKLALITGSTSGIGLGIAQVLARHGANLVLNGFGDAEQIDALVKQLAAEHGVSVSFAGGDLTKVEDIERMMKQIADEHGGIDILVNNAGIQHVSPVESFPVDRWDAVIALNLSAAFHTTRLALPRMKERNWGRIINIASAHGLVASAGKSAYVAAKHGIVGLTKAVALETATTGVTCNAICPGWVLTPLVQKQIDDRQKNLNLSPEQAREDLLGEKQPSKEFVTPEQLGEVAAFLCSPGGDQVRGAAWAVDGGWTAQ
ncbi:MAG: 3-hydroxybutyrate dehydrogenase [Lautropia sp.]|nr:3-hydroxybutyrate dehydrogenase [Lautropia sp.]